MKEIYGDIWVSAWNLEACVVVPTNGFVKKDGSAVMGRGLALQAAKKYPMLPRKLGELINTRGNRVFAFEFEQQIIVTFPVKDVWWDMADLMLIAQSARELAAMARSQSSVTFLIPHVGCGNGGLKWEDVKPILDYEFDCIDNIVVCDNSI